jgi:methylase of polypeptide subunit release factors
MAYTSSEWTDPKIWDIAGAQYENVVARSSKIGAARLITLANDLHPLSSPNARAIDLGAGTGSLTYTLAAAYPSLPILVTDITPGMLEQLISPNKNGWFASPLSKLAPRACFNPPFLLA